MTEFVRRYSASRNISDTIDWITEENGVVERLKFSTTCEDMDVNVFVDGGDNIGANTDSLETYAQINPNNDFWLSRVNTKVSPAVYYIMWKPRSLNFEVLEIEFENNLSSSRTLKEAEFIYRKIPEEVVKGKAPKGVSRPGREFDVVSIG